MSKREFKRKIGQAISNVLVLLAFSTFWAGFFVYALLH